jgi:hypothetical protein
MIKIIEIKKDFFTDVVIKESIMISRSENGFKFYLSNSLKEILFINKKEKIFLSIKVESHKSEGCFLP